MQQVTNEQRAQPIRDVIAPGLAYQVNGNPHQIVRGVEAKGLLLRQGSSPGCAWTLREVEDQAGNLRPAPPRLGEVLDALASVPPR